MMVKKSVLLMSVFACGLTLGLEAEAVKHKSQVTEGPMDKFVRRSPRTTPSIQPENLKAKNPPRSAPTISKLTQDQMRYLYARNGSSYGKRLTPMEKAFLLK